VAPSQILTSGTNGFQSFGTSVTVDGRTMVIGAPYSGDRHTGAAYIYSQQDGTWTLEQRLLPPHPLQTFGYFGMSVAVNGDTVVIGVGSESSDPNETYVYVRGTNGWTLQQILDVRGHVAIHGDNILVGDYSASVHRGTSDLDEAGVAYVFVRSSGVWTLQQRLNASDARASDYFGRGVAIEGDTAVIGAIGDLSTSDESGAAYVFIRNGTNWAQMQKLRASDPQRAADFGRALDLHGDVLVIGAPGYVDSTDQYRQPGHAYVFFRSGGTWAQQEKLTASDAAPRDGFGVSVAVTDHQIFVDQFSSSPSVYTELRPGSVYVFRRLGGSWVEQGKLAPNAGQVPDVFGIAVAADRDTLVVGDPTIVGSAYVYERLVFGRLRHTPPGLTLSFASELYRTYTVECTDSLQPPILWQTTTNVTGDGSVVEVPANPVGTMRFYRVVPAP